MEISFEVSPKESADIKEVIGQMNRQSGLELKLPAFRIRELKNGRVVVKLNENRGSEGLELLFIVLRRLERFQK